MSLHLSENQRDLLVAALTSNRSKGNHSDMAGNNRSQAVVKSHTPNDLSESSAPGSGRLDYNDNSPFLDLPLDGEGDDSFNFDESTQMFGDLPEEDDDDENGITSTDHLHDKRKSMGDVEDDDDEGGGKRREGEDKQAKKPGRKPLTNEPTSASRHCIILRSELG